jgi:ABC-2 type transport system ATP-binding protein
MSGAPALVADGLSRHFDGFVAVDRLDLRVEAGTIHALVGLNGAGKTTTMQMFLGMTEPDRGRALILGEEPLAADWSRVGHCLDAPFAYGELSVRANLTAAGLFHGISRDTVDDDVSTAIERFQLAQWEDKRASVLSTGNLQRVGLAAATIHRPDVLLLDEPTNHLDPAGVVLVRYLLREIAADGGAILLSSHHLDELARISDDITVLHRGQDIGRLDSEGLDVEREFFAMVYESERAR